LRNIINNPRFELKYFVDIDEKIAKSYAAQAPNCKALTKIDEALSDPTVQGVVICSPTATHTELILASVRAKKAVMCEKPISLKIEEVDMCYNEAKKNGVPLLCGKRMRKKKES
jgi:myo-inositol 2-dehydrogenase/D-chiro-inositol 1-dehydrogenase